MKWNYFLDPKKK